MRILVVGSGAREHAIAWKLSRSNRISGLFVAPGNAGTEAIATNLGDVGENVEQIVRAASDQRIDIVVVGPETPLANGIVDELESAGIAAIGPGRASARMESSKAFSKAFMERYGVPTAAFRTFDDAAELEQYLSDSTGRFVVKQSGLAAGKGVLETDDRNAMIEFGRQTIDRGDQVVVEEHLVGYEVSVFGVSDGRSHLLLPACTDYKKAGVGGSGPNTGGMGAICPVPWLDAKTWDRIVAEVVEPTYRGMSDAGLTYRGILYFGIMVTEDGPRVLEYNVRFGDPEAQVLLPLIGSDLVDLFDAMVTGSIASYAPTISNMSALAVVVAAPGYPSDYPTGLPVDTIPGFPDDEALVFHASTSRVDGTIHTGGGRCFTVVGMGQGLLNARARAYRAAKDVTFPGSWLRPDVGGRVFGN
ncbi:MAG: phosphoribosylamine--glycine ligase [Spirochaetaceae bacterium]|nr:MAG: phosphoribosylamine--glycine ligase [Spirochaetaceae bacterium]